jgi:cobalt-zinc-cadmium efflux system membrane fusion protein
VNRPPSLAFPAGRWLGAALALALLAGCRRPPPAPPAPPPPAVSGATVTFPPQAPQLASLSLEPAAARRLAITHLTGRLYWDDDVTVRVFTPVAGRVRKVDAELGEAVAPGAPLADLSSPDFGQALADARTAAANLAAADKAFARAQDLLAHGAAAAKDVEAAEAADQAARAEQDRARSRLALYGGPGEGGDAFVLRSPLGGVVVEKNLTPGQEVRADQMLANAPSLFAPLFVVSDPRRLWLQLDVGESDLALLQAGERLEVHSAAFPGRTFSGRILRLGEEMDPSTRTLAIRAEVANPDGLLKAEMYVSVDVVRPLEAAAGAGVEVPAKAVFLLDNQYYLFRQTGPGRFERTRVEVGTEKDGVIPVTRGVAPGEAVVVEGALLLQAIVDPAN